MKTAITLLAAVSFSVQSYSQTLFVDTLPHNKNVLIEEFTGVQCNSCPQGHIEIANLLAAYPNRVFAASMHSAATGHTNPYPGDEDLRRAFPDLLYPQTDVNALPEGVLSRRKWANNKEEFIFWPNAGYKEPIDSCANIIMNEPSPFNIGIQAVYDTVNKVLHVVSQVYTTAAASGTFRLNVYFIQSNIFVSQLNGSTVIPNYNEKHVYREMLTPTWGATMSSGASKGNVFNSALTYSNVTKNYKMQDVEAIVFITNHTGSSTLKGVVVQALAIPVTLTGATTTAVTEIEKADNLQVFPNPSASQFYLHLNNPSADNEVIVTDASGRTVLRKAIEAESSVYIEHNLSPGVYFITTKNTPAAAKQIVVY